ncbi:PucR family transcriptional regulator [Edaphobacillus lindanitolerans]|uniref:Purine catabolism regulatory protein n=1 Tax=Edaphobacillus lindanitolerans TaxID=550447 RepID=A0A1U7PP76_9BACI|nr:PucR family transcriptional regulator [Edaphobacillus lindanitolerans]SIT75376.1 purine catabolism regulatory protein [Edaphobacillus lindanitolerans]
MKEIELTVRDVLARDSFQKAKLVAGKGGTGRLVRWSHILEVRDFESLINGGELILTTGISMTLDVGTQIAYIRKLNELGVSALCIELPEPKNKIAPEVIALADELDFPVIVFEEVIRFVDITQDLHTAIINRHHQMISELDRLSGRFIELSLTSNGILKILQEVHQYFRRDVLFVTDRPAHYFYPSHVKETEAAIRQQLVQDSTLTDTVRYLETENGLFATVPVRGLGQVWGRLCMSIEEPVHDDFYFLILDRAGLSISQILLRNRTVEERKQNLEDKVVRSLITGRGTDPETVQSVLPAQGRNMYYRVMAIRFNPDSVFDSEDLLEEELVQRAMVIRSLFQRNGFFPSITSGKNEMAVLAFFISGEEQKNAENRFGQVIREIGDIPENQFPDCLFGISKVYQEIPDVKQAFGEAEDVISLRSQGVAASPFFEKLGIHRLLLLLKRSGELERYVDDYLGRLIEHDRRNDSALLETLVVYLECGGVKKEAAERLFIVRQTLYHRLEKLEALLGSNFMEPGNRIALEVAVQAHRMLARGTAEPLAMSE